MPMKHYRGPRASQLDKARTCANDRFTCRKLIAALLICGWISLSGFDVVEDLDEIPGCVAVSNTSNDRSISKRGGWMSLANNLVESANRIQQVDVVPIRLIPTIATFAQLFDFRRCSQLHKIYRVFLI